MSLSDNVSDGIGSNPGSNTVGHKYVIILAAMKFAFFIKLNEKVRILGIITGPVSIVVKDLLHLLGHLRGFIRFHLWLALF